MWPWTLACRTIVTADPANNLQKLREMKGSRALHIQTIFKPSMSPKVRGTEFKNQILKHFFGLVADLNKKGKTRRIHLQKSRASMTLHVYAFFQSSKHHLIIMRAH